MTDQAIALLIEEGTVQEGPWLHRQPPPLPAGLQDRVRGMLLGVAIGDALGNTTESINPAERRRRFGIIRDYLPSVHGTALRPGVPSDDTQLTFWTVEQLLEDGRLLPLSLLDRFQGSRIFGIGRTTHEALLLRARHGADWRYVGARGAGNGALMRIAPVVLPHLRQPSSALWTDVVLATAITHRDSAAIASAVAQVDLLWSLLGASQPPAAEEWIPRYLDVVASALPADHVYRPRGGAWADFEGSLPEWLRRCVAEFPSAESVSAAGTLWHSGAYLMETIPTVLHVLTEHIDDPKEAILCAVNETRDNDTIAAIVGAAVGALHGADAFPDRWTEGLLGRTREADDGHVQELTEAAVERFSP